MRHRVLASEDDARRLGVPSVAPVVAAIKEDERVRAWFTGAHHDELPEADQQRYLDLLGGFLAGIGKDPDELVAYCWLRKKDTGERFLPQKRRVEVNEMIDARCSATAGPRRTPCARPT